MLVRCPSLGGLLYTTGMKAVKYGAEFKHGLSFFPPDMPEEKESTETTPNTARSTPEAQSTPETQETPQAQPWQAIFSPQHGAYYFYNTLTNETTWDNPLQPSPLPSTSDASTSTSLPVPSAAADEEPPTTTTPAQAHYAALQAAAIAQGIDPALAHLDPSLLAGTGPSTGAVTDGLGEFLWFIAPSFLSICSLGPLPSFPPLLPKFPYISLRAPSSPPLRSLLAQPSAPSFTHTPPSLRPFPPSPHSPHPPPPLPLTNPTNPFFFPTRPPNIHSEIQRPNRPIHPSRRTPTRSSIRIRSGS